MSQKRRQYTREFKLEALRLMQQGGMTAVAAAEQLGVKADDLYRWKRELSRDPKAAFVGNGNRTPDDEKMIRLERENTKLKAQVQFLKKIASYFASGKN